MTLLHSTEQVHVSDTPEALDALRDPKVLAVVWTGVWSEASRAFADHITGQQEYNVPNTIKIVLRHLPEDSILRSELRECADFNNDWQRIVRVFNALGVKILGQDFYINDDSHIEPAMGKCYENVGQWHIDNGSLIMLSIPSGLTTEFLPEIPQGEFDERGRFKPANPDAAEKAAISLPQDSVIIFKANYFPGVSSREKRHNHGLLHRRPHKKLEDFPQRARLMISNFIPRT